ncbi:phage baseplate plug family protein [Klebsiella pneumoniae]
MFQGVLCLNCVYLVRYKYLGFSGDLVFVDSKGTADPYYDEIGTRFKLYYATSSEVGR